MKHTVRIQRKTSTKTANTQTESAASRLATLLRADVNPANPARYCARLELEDAANQSSALLRLLADFYDNQVGGGFLSHEYADKVSAGISQLVQVTERRMEAAVDGSLSAMKPGHN